MDLDDLAKWRPWSIARPPSGHVARRSAAMLGVTGLAAVVARRLAAANDDGGDGGDGGGAELQVEAAPRGGDRGLYERIPATTRYEVDQSSRLDGLGRWLIGRKRVPIPSYLELIEDPPPRGARRRTGICCSGGGIRSAAFNLGALQTLQEEGTLEDAEYVAAVSGGSYIAAAFAMVAKTPEPGAELGDDSDPSLFTADRQPFYRGSPEEQYLRNRSSYMAPGGSGRLRLGLRVALGLLVNLVLVTAALVVVALLLAVFYRTFHDPLQRPDDAVAAGTTTVEWWVAGALAGLGAVLGLASIFLPSRFGHAEPALEALTIKALALAGLVVVICSGIPELLAVLRGWGDAEVASDAGAASTGGGVAAVSGFGAILTAVLLELRSKLTVAGARQGAAWYAKLGSGVRRAITQLVLWLIGPLLLGSILVFALLAMVEAPAISLWVAIPVGILVLAFSYGNVTAWSLHPFYRRRLCTAFALKRIRRPTMVDDDFGMAVERDYRKLVLLSESGVEPGPGPSKTWPTLVVCAAANVSDPGATPPGRSVTSFTFSSVAMGGPLVGGIQTAAFERRLPERRRREFTLAAAVAMSGAAVSPSMGKETRASVRFLLALANVRLGVWVPNPRRRDRWVKSSRGPRTRLDRERGRAATSPTSAAAASSTPRGGSRKLIGPSPGPWYLVKEMLGWNSVNDPFLFITDGGHYENLGLVELLRRGCTEVFCFDASGSTNLKELGEAIALARSELNVEIDELDPGPLTEVDRLAERCCVTGRIRYPGGQEGVLVYVRNVVTPGAPYDVLAYRARDEAFPHHSTVDQLYTDEKFEAYRALGSHAGERAVAAATATRAQAPERNGAALFALV